MSETTYDMRELTGLISSLWFAIAGSGAEHGDMQSILKTEAGQLAWEISEQIGPKTLAEGNRKLEKDMRRTFFPLSAGWDPAQASENATNPADRQGKTAGILWLFGYKSKKSGGYFLVGAHTRDIVGNGTNLKPILYGDNSRRGAAWGRVGGRGHQGVIILNRKIVTPGAYASLAASIRKQFGQMRASFARTAMELVPKKRIPAWVAAQIQASVANGKSLFNITGLNHPTEPFIEFGSRARGVESNPKIAEKIHNSTKARMKIVADKLKNVIDGYKYQWDTGQCYRQPKITEAEE